MKLPIYALLASAMLASLGQAAVSVISNNQRYSISVEQSEDSYGDWTGEDFHAAGSQRSTNGDSYNARSGRVFAYFPLNQAMINEANLVGSAAKLTFLVNSIGMGVAGTPYVDGLDLRFIGVVSGAPDPDVQWNSPAVGADQSNILATNGVVGTLVTIGLTNASVLNTIKTATAGQTLGFTFMNTAGNVNLPVGNSQEETYSFVMNKTLANYSLIVTSPVPEPTST
jgi:hypothetical protein